MSISSQRAFGVVGASSAITYVVLAFVGSGLYMSAGSAPRFTDSPQQIAVGFTSRANTTATWAGAALETLALMFLTAFVGYLWSELRRREGSAGWLSATALGAGLISVAMKMASIAPEVAALYRAREGIEPQLAAALLDTATAFFYFSLAAASVLLAATAAVALGFDALPKWLGLAAGAIGLALLVEILFASAAWSFVPQLLFYLWLAVAGVVLARRQLTGAKP